MVRKPEELYKEALTMSAEEREELVRLLTMQADSGWASPEIEQAWVEEIDRREKEIAEGKSQWVPGEAVMRELRDRFCNSAANQ